MKRAIFSLYFLLTAAVASAQFYVRANVGYNMPMNSDLIGQDYDYHNSDAGYVESFKGIYGSYGAGLSFRAAFGGSLKNGIFGYDLEAGYLLGKEYVYSESFNGSESDNTVKTTVSSRSLQITPSFTFTTGDGKFQPFARMGPVISIGSIREKHDTYSNYGSQTYTEALEYKYKGGIGFGFKGAAGVAYRVAPKTQVYVEFDFVSLSYAPHKRETTRYDVNGQDSLDNITEKEIDLEKEFETLSEEGNPPMRQSYSMGSAGLHFGVKLALN